MLNFDQHNKHFAVWSYFDQRTRNFDTGVHAHNASELVYVESGRCKYDIVIEGKPKTEQLKAGELILIAAGSSHRLTVTRETRIQLLELRINDNEPDKPYIDVKTTIDNCPTLKKALDKSPYIALSDFGYIRPVIRRIIDLLNTNREYTDRYFTQVLIAELLLSIDQNYQKAYFGNAWVELIIEFIARSYQEDISVRDIADAINLNSSYMQKIFSLHMGNTIHDYLTGFRITQSIALMKNTNMAFEDIAAEVGFNNRQTFYNAFLAHTGYSPKLFKKHLATPNVNYIPIL